MSKASTRKRAEREAKAEATVIPAAALDPSVLAQLRADAWARSVPGTPYGTTVPVVVKEPGA